MNKSEVLAGLNKKLRKKTSILTDEEVSIVAREVSRLIGRDMVGLATRYGLRIEDGLRWQSLGAKCEQERSNRGFTIKDIASEIHRPQYRLRAVERGSLREFRPEVAHEYFAFLAIGRWVKRWARANQELATRAGIVPFPIRPGRKGPVTRKRNLTIA